MAPEPQRPAPSQADPHPHAGAPSRSGETPVRRGRSAAILLVASAGGAGTMSVELSAVRLLAPWFGTSLVVWTNVIGVVLLALSVGYLLGARLSRGPRPLRALGALLVGAALATAVVPAFARPAAELFMPEGVALHTVAGLLGWGSLAASFVLFLVPAALLGTAGPLAVEAIALSTGAHAGTAGGRVLAASTVGSLVGTFTTTHVAIPTLGVSTTFLLAALALAAAGGLALFLDRRTSAAGALVAVAAAAVAPGMGLPELDGGTIELFAEESPYQWVRVVERGEGEARMRQLVVNEALDSYQSVWRPEPGPLGRGYYYDAFALPPHWDERAGADGGPWRTLVLGLGAGTAVRVLAEALPEGMTLDSLGVELDPAVMRAGAAHMDLEPDGPGRRTVAGLDARAALRHVEPGFDEVVLDVYANQFEIPPHLCSVELFGEVRDVLREGGWLAANVGGFGFDDPVVAAVARTAAEAFGSEVLCLRVPDSRNVVLVARRGGSLPRPGDPRWEPGGPVADALGAGLAARVAVPGAWRVVAPGGGGAVLTDERNPIERLQLRSIELAAAALRGEGSP